MNISDPQQIAINLEADQRNDATEETLYTDRLVSSLHNIFTGSNEISSTNLQ